ncbi:N-6 DNA methylase [Aliarcobacter butzleri]|uniref:N-6 DNA methylase n=1 Tax=Aliarcobacter butzleri TaxID=28197 RepID=UPI001EDB6805|nr:N-6 DNA methylase [Aliarcobacter butzleri]MCG3669265.1 N-6 DNA methylase [Aliarcobacter butzleri]MCG3677515.1 N-6 DNA methylase [Aliarcobacter butzleri]MCT7631171.1 N-6 DNA methylase [Aliarcobacter butzleri]
MFTDNYTDKTMSLNELEKMIDYIPNVYKNELLELIYILRAWEILSLHKIKDENLNYYTFIESKIEIKKLAEIFNKLSEEIKLFRIYKLDVDKFEDGHLDLIIDRLKNTLKLPTIHDAFFLSKFRIDIPLVSSQVAEMGLKLLIDSRFRTVPYYIPELYVPFTQGFAYSKFLNTLIYTDSQTPKYSLVAELISICGFADIAVSAIESRDNESEDIEFILSNALENPSYLDQNNKNKLREFEYVLSFPPYSVKQNFDYKNDKFNRFKFQKGSVLDIAYFEHILAQTKYRAVVLMPVGFTYRSGNEELFRKYLIEKNYLEGIVQLPPNLHSATSIETTFFIINKIRNQHALKPNDIMFINLKDESFIKREGRQLVFKSVDEIRDIYINKKEIKNISALISREEIVANNYSFAIDKYVVTEKTKEVQKELEKFELIRLEDIADIRKSQLFKDEEKGLEIFEISPSDFSKAGFTLECGKIKKIESQKNRLDTYKLEPYDVLLSTKGTIGKVAIIGKIDKPIIASQAIQVIRLKEDKEEKAIILYMFLKSNIGQTILSSITSGTVMPQISTVEVKNLGIPKLTEESEKTIFLNFDNEIEMYNKINHLEKEIEKIHNNFLEVI